MYRIKFTHHKNNGDGTVAITEMVKFKATAASATNLVHKVHGSLSHNLVEFAMETPAGWVEYDFPWTGRHAEVKERVLELEAFHELWYEEVPEPG